MRRRLVQNLSARGRTEAIRLRETFQDTEAEWENHYSWSWPQTMRCIGEGFAVMYRSDKWKKKGNFESYKHVCESERPWKLYAAPGFEVAGATFYGTQKAVPEAQMPTTVATLANYLGVQCRLYEKDGGRLVMPEGDDGIYEIQIPRAKLAAGRTKSGSLFLCVFVEEEGPKLFIFGTELDVEKDGIVG